MARANPQACCVDRGLQMQGCLCLPGCLLWVITVPLVDRVWNWGLPFLFFPLYCLFEASRIREWACTCKLLAFAVCENAVEGDDVTSTFMYIFILDPGGMMVYTNCGQGWSTTGKETPRPMKVNVTFSLSF